MAAAFTLPAGCAKDPTEAGTSDSTEGETSSESLSSEAGTGEVSSAEAEASTGPTDTTSGDGDGDTNTDTGTTGTSPDWNFGDHYGLPNIDDDNGNGNVDWFDGLNVDDDDPREMVIGASKFQDFGAGDQVRITLGGATSQIRVWHNGNPVVGDNTPGTIYAFTPGGGDETLTIEFANFLDEGTLTLDHIDGANTVIDSDTIRLLASPLILNHHLQPAEHVYMTDVGNQNAAMVDGYAAVLGTAFTAVSGNQVGFDVWMQDEPEFATSTAPGGIRINTVIDSIRDRGLDNFAELYFGGEPDWFIGTWGTQNQQTSEDSFGNLEISPPVTVGGVEYPFGRIYYGGGMHSGMVNFLESQKIQDPIEMDTSFLCVGHVDEYISTVADPNSPKGFKVLYADATAGMALLDSMSGSVQLTRFGQDYGYPSVASMQSDGALDTLNSDIQIDNLDPMRERLKAELGLDDSDFIFIPTIFELVNQCGGRTVALIPGTVNLIVANGVGESPTLFVPDPFMRPSGASVNQDTFANDFVARMPDDWNVTFLDNWNTYHVALGEVHCGTNVIRTPVADWWDVGLHLLD